MKVEVVDKNIVKVVIEKNDYDLDKYFDDLIFLEKKKILTFGDAHFRILEKFFKTNGYPIELLDLCFEDDKSIGLQMPNTWYLNKGKHALPISMYYNYLNFREFVERGVFDTFNQEIIRDYGRVACIEIYTEDDLLPFLDRHQIDYFSTPRTLTECIRYLEGWDLTAYPRLKGYATFSRFIELWSRINFPDFNAQEWHLGKEKSNQINNTGITNVRLAVRYFWENYLLERHEKTAPEDIELDILGGIKFREIRQPKILLISEDLFSSKNSDYEIFRNLTTQMEINKMYISNRKNDFPLKNARAAQSLFPDSQIVLIEMSQEFKRNFTLINQIKHGINTDIVITTKVLRHLLEDGKR